MVALKGIFDVYYTLLVLLRHRAILPPIRLVALPRPRIQPGKCHRRLLKGPQSHAAAE